MYFRDAGSEYEVLRKLARRGGKLKRSVEQIAVKRIRRECVRFGDQALGRNKAQASNHSVYNVDLECVVML